VRFVVRNSFRLARGVGSNGKDPVTAVRGADGSCRYAIPDNVIPALGQAPENLSPHGSIVESKEMRHVLHQHVPGSKLANGSEHLEPQNGLGMVEPVPLPSSRSALAGEPAGDEVNGLAAIADVSNICMDPGIRPSLVEDASSPFVGFAEPGVLDSGLMEAVVE
jgi:hypothetical protein